MMFSKLFSAGTVSALVASSSAHMLLAKPEPFPAYGSNNGPVESSGSNFPCRITDYSGQRTVHQAGQEYDLEFKGGATHGGGSCQVSLSPDSAPTKGSEWKVILSIIGGCPAKTGGNTSGDANNRVGLESFKYQIPKDIPDGDYTLSWSWINRLGNREFYHNCAPITVKGNGKGDKSALDSLPDMFIANIPSLSQCTTIPDTDFLFPNPGQNVVNGGYDQKQAGCEGGAGGQGPKNDAQAPKNDAQAPKKDGKGTEEYEPTDKTEKPYGGQEGYGTAPSAPVSSPPVSSPAAPGAGAYGGAPAPGSESSTQTSQGAAPTGSPGAGDYGAIFAENANNPSTMATSTVTSKETVVPVEDDKKDVGPTEDYDNDTVNASAGSSSQVGLSSGSGSCPAGWESCSTEGFSCVDETSFIQCSHGCGMKQDVAAGTKCVGNAIQFARRSYIPPQARRRHI